MEPITGCVTNQVAPTPLSFNNATVNLVVAAGFSPTGTVEVEGVIDARIPESRLTVPAPLLFFSAVEVAVSVITGAGCGVTLACNESNSEAEAEEATLRRRTVADPAASSQRPRTCVFTRESPFGAEESARVSP